jgi:two-component system chemotaxis response regulator CheB
LSCCTCLPTARAHSPRSSSGSAPSASSPARDGDQLTPGRVVVAPAGQHLLITSELRLALIESGAFPPSRPSADLLLTTLAIAAGPRAIAVVLSGTGHDGATGATAVHRFGGTVLATDEASSQSFAMPSATIRLLALTALDLALDLTSGDEA